MVRDGREHTRVSWAMRAMAVVGGAEQVAARCWEWAESRMLLSGGRANNLSRRWLVANCFISLVSAAGAVRQHFNAMDQDDESPRTGTDAGSPRAYPGWGESGKAMGGAAGSQAAAVALALAPKLPPPSHCPGRASRGAGQAQGRGAPGPHSSSPNPSRDPGSGSRRVWNVDSDLPASAEARLQSRVNLRHPQSGVAKFEMLLNLAAGAWRVAAPGLALPPPSRAMR